MGFLGDLAKGTLGGVAQGFNQAQDPKAILARKSLALQERSKAVTAATTVMNVLTEDQPPEMIEFKMLKLADIFGLDRKNIGVKDGIALLKRLDTEELNDMKDMLNLSLKDADGKTPPIAMINTFARNLISNPETALKFVNKFQEGKRARERERRMAKAIAETSGPSPEPGAPGPINLKGAIDRLLRGGNTAQAEALQKIRSGRLTADQIGKPTPGQAANIRTFMGQDGKPFPVNMRDSVAVSAAIDKKAFPVNFTPGIVTGLTKSDASKVRQERARLTASIASMGNLLRSVKTLPSGATGGRGKLGRALGGFGEQLGDILGQKGWGDAISNFMTGVSQQELANFQLRARRATVGAIPDLSGEKSSRVSEFEFRRTQEAARIEVAGASPQQIVGALTALLGYKILESERFNIVEGKSFAFDVSTVDRQVAMSKLFAGQLGMDQADANQLVADLVQHQQFLLDFGNLEPNLKLLGRGE
jgi:hypothetical protein